MTYPLPPRALVGMVHTLALPGTPGWRGRLLPVVDRAVREAKTLAAAGFDALIIENMNDVPYVTAPHAPEITAAMTRVAAEVRRALPNLPLGIQVLSFGHAEALAVAIASECQFIRVENFSFAHVADEGLLAHAAAGPLLRERARLGARRIAFFADIKKKHASHAITADLPLADAAHSAEMFGADALIVSGTFTGKPTDPSDVLAAKHASHLPVVVGSGVTAPQVRSLLQHADALIVGTATKKGGRWQNEVDPARAKAIVKARRG